MFVLMQFLTFNEARGAFGDSAKKSLFEQSLRKAEFSEPGNRTFLSHSSKDKEYLATVVGVLEGHGASIYVDKRDPKLPTIPNVDTAKVLRERISQCSKFVVMSSRNSCDSKWVPWELGLADGKKNLGNIALFPISETAYDQGWAEQEYLGLYDRVVWGRINNSESGWIVWNHTTNKAVTLRRWLAR